MRWVVLVLFVAMAATAIPSEPSPRFTGVESPIGHTSLFLYQETWAGTLALGRDEAPDRLTADLVLHYADAGVKEVISTKATNDGGANTTYWYGISWGEEPMVTWLKRHTVNGYPFYHAYYATYEDGWSEKLLYTFHDPPEVTQCCIPNLQSISNPVITPEGVSLAIADLREDGAWDGKVLWATYDGSWEFTEISLLEEGSTAGRFLALVDHEGTSHVLHYYKNASGIDSVVHLYEENGEWRKEAIPGAVSLAEHAGPAGHEGDLLTVLVNLDESSGIARFDGHWQVEPFAEWGRRLLVDPTRERMAVLTWGPTQSLYIREGTGWAEWEISKGTGGAFGWVDNHAVAWSNVTQNPTHERMVVAPTNDAPIARFAMIGDASTRQAVSLTDTSMGDVSGVEWELESESVSGSEVEYVLSSPGRHWVRMTATGPGGSDTGVGPVDVVQYGPVACIDAPSSGTRDVGVLFKDCSTHVEADLDASWTASWDFGDGSTSSSKNPSHAYVSAGSYTVTLTVTDDQGMQDEATAMVSVVDPPPNQEPVVDFSFVPSNPVAGEEVVFTGSASDSDGVIASSAWRVGGESVGSGLELKQVFEAGSFEVEFMATDDDGASVVKKRFVNVVAPVAPEVSISGHLEETAGKPLEVEVRLENPNPVPVVAVLSHDAPTDWNASLAQSVELDAGESKELTFSLAPPYFVGGLTTINIEATVDEAVDSVILRVQLQVGQAPIVEDETPENEQEQITPQPQPLQETQQSKGTPTWIWIAGGITAIVAVVGGAFAFQMRRS